MRTNFKFKYMVAFAIILAGLLAGSARGSWTFIFTDNFDGGASPLWGNESGDWLASDGVYYAQAPGNSPHICNSLPFNLRNFAIDVDIIGVSDGGIWLRNDGTGRGVLLVTGGYGCTGTGLYWHEMQDFYSGSGPLNGVPDLFQQGDDIHLHIEVVGNTYSVFLNGSTTPATTLLTSDYYSGRVALYDFAPSQAFNNFVLTIVPEPATICLLGLGGLALMRKRRK